MGRSPSTRRRLPSATSPRSTRRSRGGRWAARGPAAAGAELAAAAAGLVEAPPQAERRYEAALERFTALGAGDLDARIEQVLDDLGVGAELAGRDASILSGGQRAKVALAGIELSHFDITLLDEPTNDLDFAGLRRLEQWVVSREGGTVVVRSEEHTS